MAERKSVGDILREKGLLQEGEVFITNTNRDRSKIGNPLHQTTPMKQGLEQYGKWQYIKIVDETYWETEGQFKRIESMQALVGKRRVSG